MKKTKTKNLLFSAVMLIIIGSLVIAVTGSQAPESSFKASYQKSCSLTGTIEISLTPAGDNRVWHIENKFTAHERGDGPGCNMAAYTFTKDSVYVLREYANVPDQDGLDSSLINILLIKNNLNN